MEFYSAATALFDLFRPEDVFVLVFFHFLRLMEHCFKLYLPLSVFFRCLVTGRLMVSPHGLCC